MNYRKNNKVTFYSTVDEGIAYLFDKAVRHKTGSSRKRSEEIETLMEVYIDTYYNSSLEEVSLEEQPLTT